MTAEQVTFEDFSESPNRARDPARVDALADEIEAILTDPTRCTWCGTQVRQYDRDHDEAEAVHLSVGDTKGAFYAAGHRLAEDGTVDAHYRLRLTRHATRDAFATATTFSAGPAVACRVTPSRGRPTEWLVEAVTNLLEDVEHDLDPDTLAAAVDAANDADTDDYHALATALLAATPIPPKSDG
ncbi:hypothetical protein ACFQL0_22140 [Haloplanus litoreus]|uniref:hypothetical protein n=1 Tax=Haloplanus litoreus TaxID=767515 RepID=UPI003613508D